MPRVETDSLIAFFNEVAALDPAFMVRMIEARHPCNEAVADHPSIQAATADEMKELGTDTGGLSAVGFLGLINGYCGLVGGDGPRAQWGPICVEVDKRKGKLKVTFARTAEAAVRQLDPAVSPVTIPGPYHAD